MNSEAQTLAISADEWRLPDKGKVGMACLIVAESAIFIIFVVAYLFYIGKSLFRTNPGRGSVDSGVWYDLPAFKQHHGARCGYRA